MPAGTCPGRSGERPAGLQTVSGLPAVTPGGGRAGLRRGGWCGSTGRDGGGPGERSGERTPAPRGTAPGTPRRGETTFAYPRPLADLHNHASCISMATPSISLFGPSRPAPLSDWRPLAPRPALGYKSSIRGGGSAEVLGAGGGKGRRSRGRPLPP